MGMGAGGFTPKSVSLERSSEFLAMVETCHYISRTRKGLMLLRSIIGRHLRLRNCLRTLHIVGRGETRILQMQVSGFWVLTYPAGLVQWLPGVCAAGSYLSLICYRAIAHRH